MPELPDVAVYLEALERADRRRGAPVAAGPHAVPAALGRSGARGLRGPARHRTASAGQAPRVRATTATSSSVIHLMIAGRLHWADAGRKPPGRKPLLEFQFSTGTLTLTEAGSKRRASLHLVRGEDALAAHDPGGIEPLAVDAAAFARALRSANHTLEARAHRSAPDLGDRQRLLGRDPAPRAALADRADPEARRRRARAPLRGDPGRAARVDRAAARAGGRRLPRGRDRVPAGDGGARPLPPAVPGVRLAGAAHRARRERDQLLRALSDRRAAARGPRAVAPAQGRLAETFEELEALRSR